MKFTRNAKAISKLLLILLLLTATTVGALLSYLWVLGYYVSLDRIYPEGVTVNITDYAFDYQNTSYFNVTIQCPTSYKSKETANIIQIAVSTKDGVLHDKIDTNPSLPYKFQHKGVSETFKCLWNWANYTGETVEIVAFIEGGSGPTFEIETPLVNFDITDIRFNSTISVTHFNLTVQNSAASVTYVNITGVSVEEETISAENISINLPYPLHQNESVPFQCMYNWTKHQDKNVTVAVYTWQGYVAYHTYQTPKPVNLTITNVIFNVTDPTPSFDVTVQNSEDSPTYVNITRITLTAENQTVQEWSEENKTEIDPDLPYRLNPNSSQTFSCLNWTAQRDKNVTVTVYTLQGFTAQYTKVTPPPIILEIIDPIFNPLETNSFNVTVKNSEFSTVEANVTKIIVNVDGISENITDVFPSLQGGVSLPIGANQTFNCTWSWAEYSGKNVTIVVGTQEGYSASSSPVRLAVLTISYVDFNSLDTEHFMVTVQNPTGRNFTVTTMNVTVEGEFPLNITGYVVPSLPRMLTPNTNLTFMCEWNWKDDLGKNVTITIETQEGFTTSHTLKIPST